MRKAGYKTTEFWFTLVSFIFSGLYLVGLVNDNNQKEELISTVSHAVESCILIGGQFVILYKYITSRRQAKIEYEKTKQIEAEHKHTNPLDHIEGEEHEQQRTDNSRSRSTNSKSKRQPSKRKKTSTKRSVENSTGSDSKRNTNNRKTGHRSKKS